MPGPDPRTRPGAVQDVAWRLRRGLGPRGRRAARWAVDAVGASVLGSIARARPSGLVALTLDDGPDPGVTPAVLDLLAALEVRATFFLLTDQARVHPHLVTGIVAGGHEIALHGRDHRRITTMSGPDARRYLARARAELEQIGGQSVAWYRPPYGAQSVTSLRAVRAVGLQPVVWSADAEDWRDRPVASVVREGLCRLDDGGILLLHERLEPDLPRAAPTTSFDRVAMVEGVVAGVRARGLTPGGVDDLLAAGRARRTVWLRP